MTNRSSLNPVDTQLLHAADADESITVTGQTPIYIQVPAGEALYDANGNGIINVDPGYYDPRTTADTLNPQRSINSFNTSQGPVYVATSAKSGSSNAHGTTFQGEATNLDSNGHGVIVDGSSGHNDPGNTVITAHWSSTETYTKNADGSTSETKSGSGDIYISPPQQLTDVTNVLNRILNDVATAVEHYLRVGSKSLGPANSTGAPATYGETPIDLATLLSISQYLVNDIAVDFASDYGGITSTASPSSVAYGVNIPNSVSLASVQSSAGSHGASSSTQVTPSLSQSVYHNTALMSHMS